MSKRTKVQYRIDAVCLIALVAAIICAFTSYLARRSIVHDLELTSPIVSNVQSGALVALSRADGGTFYVTQDQVEHLDRLALVTDVSLVILFVSAALVIFRGVIPRLIVERPQQPDTE